MAEKNTADAQTGSIDVLSGKDEKVSQVYAPMAEAGVEEVERSSLDLAISGLIAGLDIGFGPLAMAVAAGRLHDSFHLSLKASILLGSLLYPLGFVFVILGKSELFTESTLAPVAGVISDLRKLPGLFRTWALILTFNIAGTILFSLLASHISVVFTPYHEIYRAIATPAVQQPFLQAMLAGVLAGWLVALIGWLIETTRGSIVHFIEIYVVGFLIVALGLLHSIIGTVEVLMGMFAGAPITWGTWLESFLAPVVLGNVIGGVFFVTGLKGFQAAVNARGGAEDSSGE